MKRDVSGFAYILPIGILVLCHANSAFAQSAQPGLACNGLQVVHTDAAALENAPAGLLTAAGAQTVDLRGSVTSNDINLFGDIVSVSALGMMALDGELPGGGSGDPMPANPVVVTVPIPFGVTADALTPPIPADAVSFEATDADLRQMSGASPALTRFAGNIATFLVMQIRSFETRVDLSLRGIAAVLGSVVNDGSSTNLFSNPSYQLRGIVPADASAAPTIIDADGKKPTATGTTVADDAVHAESSVSMAFGSGMSTIHAGKSARAAMSANFSACFDAPSREFWSAQRFSVQFG